MTGTREQLTSRQREVLRLIAKGHTNGEIAEQLGISLDGAKWHVSEIITRLGVATRDEAADYWNAEQSMRRKVMRLGWPWPVAIASGLAVFACVVIFGVFVTAVFWRGDGDEGDLPAASPSASVTNVPGSTPTTLPTPATITGLFTEPRERDPDRIVTLDFPESPFPEWNGNAVIYDIAKGETIDLGPGAVPIFNSGGTLAAWVAGDIATPGAKTDAWLIDLATRERTFLGPGDGVWWEGDTRIAFGGRGNFVQTLDLATSELTPGGGSSAPPHEYLTRDPQIDYGYMVAWSNRRGNVGFLAYTWSVTDEAGMSVVADFDAFIVRPIDRSTIVVATEAWGPGLRTNLFMVDLTTRQATFVASTGGSGGENVPLDGNERFLVWAEGFCGVPQGDIFVYDRPAGTTARLTGIPDRFPGWKDTNVRMVDEDTFSLGSFGDYALVNAGTLEVEITLPANTPSWTADRQFAANGWVGGHGLCP